jgi:hypothetical protein
MSVNLRSRDEKNALGDFTLQALMEKLTEEGDKTSRPFNKFAEYKGRTPDGSEGGGGGGATTVTEAPKKAEPAKAKAKEAAKPAASASAVDDSAVKELSEKVRAMKEKLKGQGVTGKDMNGHPELKPLIDELLKLKAGSSQSSAPPAPAKKEAPKAEAKKESKNDAKKEAPKPAAKKESPKPTGTTNGSADADEAHLAEYPYLGGYAPSKKDAQVFALTKTLPKTPNMLRWYEHINSFTDMEKESWS